MPSATIGTSASQPLGATSAPCCRRVLLSADPSNTGTIYANAGTTCTVPAGGNVATDGMVVPKAPNPPLEIPYTSLLAAGSSVPDISRIWCIASGAGQVVEALVQ